MLPTSWKVMFLKKQAEVRAVKSKNYGTKVRRLLPTISDPAMLLDHNAGSVTDIFRKSKSIIVSNVQNNQNNHNQNHNPTTNNSDVLELLQKRKAFFDQVDSQVKLATTPLKQPKRPLEKTDQQSW